MGKHTSTNDVGNAEVPRREAKLSTASVASCRICYDNEKREELMTPCYCKGSVAFVHRSCLETWLLESGMNRCEICHQLYRTDREESSRIQTLWEWFKSSSRSPEHTVRVHIMACTVITPLAITLVTYIFCMYYSDQATSSTSSESNESSGKDQATNLLTVLGIILIGYYLWVYSVTRIHSRWQRSCIIRYIPRNIPTEEPEIVISPNLNVQSRAEQNEPVLNQPPPQSDSGATNPEHAEERDVLLDQINDTDVQRDGADLSSSFVSYFPPAFGCNGHFENEPQIKEKLLPIEAENNNSFKNNGSIYKPQMIGQYDNILFQIQPISGRVNLGPYIIYAHNPIFEIKYENKKISHHKSRGINKLPLKRFKPKTLKVETFSACRCVNEIQQPKDKPKIAIFDGKDGFTFYP